MIKKSKYKYYMGIAEAVATNSPDSETKIGAILVNNDTGNLISSGFNGFLRKADDSILPNTRPEKYKYIVHSEVNVICQCAQNGLSMKNSTLVSTMSPCLNCARMLYQAGVTTIIAKQQYKDFEDLGKQVDFHMKSWIDDDSGFTVIEYSGITI